MNKFKTKITKTITRVTETINLIFKTKLNESIFRFIKIIAQLQINSLYLRLMRIDKPIPCLLLMMPIWWLLILEYNGQFLKSLTYFMILTLGGVVMRSAGCIINDILDRKFDAKIERTKKRILANNDLTLQQSIIALGILLCVAFGLMLTLPTAAIKFCFFIPVMVLIYPLSKRFIVVPQFVLGLTYNLGIWVAYLTIQSTNDFYTPGLIYIAAVFWTFGYDTMYAYQDIEDDKKLGLYSSAIYFGDKLPESVWNLYKASCICIGLIGLMHQLSLLFFGFLAIAAYSLYIQTERFNKAKPEIAAENFNYNIIFGLLITVGFLIG